MALTLPVQRRETRRRRDQPASDAPAGACRNAAPAPRDDRRPTAPRRSRHREAPRSHPHGSPRPTRPRPRRTAQPTVDPPPSASRSAAAPAASDGSRVIFGFASNLSIVALLVRGTVLVHQPRERDRVLVRHPNTTVRDRLPRLPVCGVPWISTITEIHLHPTHQVVRTRRRRLVTRPLPLRRCHHGLNRGDQYVPGRRMSLLPHRHPVRPSTSPFSRTAAMPKRSGPATGDARSSSSSIPGPNTGHRARMASS